MSNKHFKFKQYLLGNLSESETVEIDLSLIASNELENDLHFAEQDLIEDYLENSLTQEEKSLFINNFLISEERRQSLSEIAHLKALAQNSVIQDEPASESFFNQLKMFLGANLRPLTFGFGILLVGVLIFTLIKNTGTTELTLLEKQTQELNRNKLDNLEDFQNLTKISLFSGTFRSTGNSDVLPVNNLTDKTLFRLALPPEISDAESVKIKIFGNQNEVINITNASLYSNQNGKEIRFLLPSEFIKKGNYKVEVSIKDFKLDYAFKAQ